MTAEQNEISYTMSKDMIYELLCEHVGLMFKSNIKINLSIDCDGDLSVGLELTDDAQEDDEQEDDELINRQPTYKTYKQGRVIKRQGKKANKKRTK